MPSLNSKQRRGSATVTAADHSVRRLSVPRPDEARHHLFDPANCACDCGPRSLSCACNAIRMVAINAFASSFTWPLKHKHNSQQATSSTTSLATTTTTLTTTSGDVFFKNQSENSTLIEYSDNSRGGVSQNLLN